MPTIHNKPRFSAIHPDVDTLAAWRDQLSLTTHTPQLKQQLLAHPHDYLPRFAQQYYTLRALPRRLRRSLQRQWKQSLAGMALLLTLGQAPALAAIINVGGACTLVDAITAANSDAATGGCSAGSDADTIVLPRGSTQTLTTVNNSTYSEPNGLPVIASEITIQGNNSTITRDSSAPAFRIFAVGQTGNLTLQQGTVSGGVDGIFGAPDSMLTLLDSSVSGNAGNGLAGNGISLYYSATASLINSTLSGNSRAGLYGIGAKASLTNCTVSGNASAGVYSGRLNSVTINNTMISNNGDGVRAYRESAVQINNSTISGNSGTGVEATLRARVELTNSTVSGNLGVGIDISFRSGARLAHSVISGNSGAIGPEVVSVYDPYYGGSVTVDDLNIFGHDGNAGVSGFTPGPTDIVPSGPVGSIFNPTLADNGGPTLTHALVSGSPAVDAAGTTCPATDQRGIPRPQGTACDIGAVEFIPAAPTTCGGVAITIFGSPLHDTLTGTPGVDVIHGRGGNDTINGLGGNDLLCGGTGNDILNGALGNDSLFGDTGVDTAQFFSTTTGVTVNLSTGSAAGLGNDTLVNVENVLGTALADILIGNGFANVLNGAGGNDLLTGATGNDILIGGTGIDTAQFFGSVGITANLATGSATGLGSDTLFTIENLTGGNVIDTLTGNATANVLNGGAGNDTLSGLSGNDTLNGGDGNDAMNGGTQTDTCNGQAGTGDSATACETVSGVP